MTIMKKALYCGSFDPFTLGHLNVIEQALNYSCAHYHTLEKIYICIGDNENKTPLFSKDERAKMIKDFFNNHRLQNNVEVITYQGLTVNLAYQLGVNYLIRGVKKNDEASKNEELKLSRINEKLAKTLGFKLETLIFETKTDIMGCVSSSLVKTLCSIEEYITVADMVPANVHEELMCHYLKPRFINLFHQGCRSVAESYWVELVSAYHGRPYHNLSHLGFMFNLYNRYKAIKNIKKTNIDVELAIFAHDIVYTPGAQDNELKSAQQALSWYGTKYSSKSLDILTNLILATKPETNPATEDEAIVKDLDLSILGSFSQNIFKNYSSGIRQEYSSYSKEEYIEKRTAFINSLLSSKHIFNTEFFFSCFENQARENLKQELFSFRYLKK